jgi:hypothetical protein
MQSEEKFRGKEGGKRVIDPEMPEKGSDPIGEST